jgi:hypothetical protein
MAVLGDSIPVWCAYLSAVANDNKPGKVPGWSGGFLVAVLKNLDFLKRDKAA